MVHTWFTGPNASTLKIFRRTPLSPGRVRVPLQTMLTAEVRTPNWLESGLAWLTPGAAKPSSPAPPQSHRTVATFEAASPTYSEQHGWAESEQQWTVDPEEAPPSAKHHADDAVEDWYYEQPHSPPYQRSTPSQEQQHVAAAREKSPHRAALAPREENTLPPASARTAAYSSIAVAPPPAPASARNSGVALAPAPAPTAAAAPTGHTDVTSTRAALRAEARQQRRSHSPRVGGGGGDDVGGGVSTAAMHSSSTRELHTSAMHTSARSFCSSSTSSARGFVGGGGGGGGGSGSERELGFGSSRPRFGSEANAKVPQPHPAVIRAVEAAAPLARDRARGLHAAYAQCAALRRMLTALRVNRLLTRWRVAVEIICHDEAFALATKARHALEHAIVEEHKRAERALVEERKESIKRAHLFGLMVQADMEERNKLVHYFGTWCSMVQLLEGETAVQAEAAAKAQAHRTREHLKEALATKTAELASAKKMIQKPTLMERELAEQGAELERTRAELLDAHKRIKGHERRATMAEERVAALRIEMGKEREKAKREVAAAAAVSASSQPQQQQQDVPARSASPGRAGGDGSSPPKSQPASRPASSGGAAAPAARGAAPAAAAAAAHHHGAKADEKVHLEFEIKQLRKSLSESISERQQLTSKLDGMRGKVQQLSEAQKRLRANRFQALLMLRMHARIGPALRRWQAVSLVVDHSDSSRVAGSRDLLPMDAATTGEARTFDAGEQRQSRIIALQRELLDREAQLGAAHQASLDWREERSRLTQQLAAAQADAQATRSRMADAALAAAAAAEREARAELTGAQRQLKELRTKLNLVEDGLEKGASESHELRQALAASVQELRQARAQAEAAQRAERHASARVEEIEDARISEAEHAKERIDALEAQVREMQEASVAAVKNRPLTVQREMRDSQKEAEALKAQVAELTRKGNLQQKRMNDAEARMEGLQKELERYRQKQSHSLKLALASPRTREGLVAHSLSAGGGFGSPVPSSPRHTEHPQETYLAPQPIYQPPAARGASPRRGAETSPRAGPLRPQLAAAAPSAAGSEQGSERATRPAKSRMPPMAPSR